MKAIRIHEFGEPEVMKLEEVPDPEPGAGEVLVRVIAAGVNPVETYVRSGLYPMAPALPFTPGTDAAGVVEAVGEGITRFRPGDRVYTFRTMTGSYAEKTLCSEQNLHHLPGRISFSLGAGLGVPYSAAFRALFQRARAVAGETVLVHGASGGVGIAAVQLARAAGLTVIGTAGTEESMELVLREGAHHALNHRQPGYLDRIPELTGGQGVEIVIEMLANVNLGKDLGILAMGGRVIVIGSRGTVEINPRDTMARESSVLGLLLWNTSDRELRSIHAALGAGMENGTIRPVVGRELPLSEASKAHHLIMEARAYGKTVLIP